MSVPRHKDVHAGLLVVKVRGSKKYVYSVHRVGKKVLSVYVGPYYDASVLRSFMEYHRARVQFYEGKLAYHRQCLELAEKESAKMQRVNRQLERYGAVVPNK
jgi:hypothetical protein